jgi:hypothetical protein
VKGRGEQGESDTLGRNQSRSQYTIIKVSLSGPSFTLLAQTFSHCSDFISPYLPWYVILCRLSGFSFYSLGSLLLYTFLSPLLLPCTIPYSTKYLLDYLLWLILPWCTLKQHKMKETLSDLDFLRYDLSQGHIVCFFPHFFSSRRETREKRKNEKLKCLK